VVRLRLTSRRFLLFPPLRFLDSGLSCSKTFAAPGVRFSFLAFPLFSGRRVIDHWRDVIEYSFPSFALFLTLSFQLFESSRFSRPLFIVQSCLIDFFLSPFNSLSAFFPPAFYHHPSRPSLDLSPLTSVPTVTSPQKSISPGTRGYELRCSPPFR